MKPQVRFIGYPYPDHRLDRWGADLIRDLHYALRSLTRTPRFSALVAGMLAVGIGVTATMANVLDRLLLRPPPKIQNAGAVVRPVLAGAGLGAGETHLLHVSLPLLIDLGGDVHSFADVAGYDPAGLSLGIGPDAIRVHASLVTANFFSLLGVRPIAGRFFGAADGLPMDGSGGGPPLAVIGYGFWMRQFGGSPTVLGRPISLGKLSYTVVGVAPQGFRGVETTTPDIWIPATVAAPVEYPALWFDGRGAAWLTPIARLRPGVDRRLAAAQATTVLRRETSFSDRVDSTSRLTLASVRAGSGADAPRQTTLLLWLGGLSALVLLIACANTANLLMGRAVVRQPEVAVRRALGAGNARVVRHFLVEAAVHAGIAGVAAIALATAATRAIEGQLTAADLGSGSLMDVHLWAFVALLGAVIAPLLALGPWLQSAGIDVTRTLRSAGTTGDVRSASMRQTLVGTQAALAMALIAAAVMAVQSLRRVLAIDLGMDLDHTLVVSFDIDRLLAPPAVGLDSTFALLSERLRALPGVERVAVAQGGYGAGHAVGAHTREHDSDYFLLRPGNTEVPIETAVDSGFFRTVGAHSLRGRDFDASDRRGTLPVAIVSEPLAHLLWEGQPALGRCLLLDEPPKNESNGCVTVVGIVPAFRLGDMFSRGELQVYRPLSQNQYWFPLPSLLYIRIHGAVPPVISNVRRAIQTARPDLPAVSITWMRAAVAPEVRPWRLAAILFSIFGGVALLIATAGLYGVVARSVVQRAQEVAIRRTCGATARDILLAVSGRTFLTVVFGLMAGLAVLIAAHGLLAHVLYQTSPLDPTILGCVTVLMTSAAAAAVVLPILRFMNLSPAAVLRGE